MEQLSGRQEQILKALILEYIDAADPVPSVAIAKKCDTLKVRSATIRSELSLITEMGLLNQPHTSAGRVPSDLGYRYYVDKLIVERQPTQQAQSQLKTASGREETLNELLAETTRLLSRMTRLFAASATLKNSSLPVQSAAVTKLGPETAILVLVLKSGEVENRIVQSQTGIGEDEISEANVALHEFVQNQPLIKVSRMPLPKADESPRSQFLRRTLLASKAAADSLMGGHLISGGEQYLLAQPEFQQNPESREALMESLEDSQGLKAAVSGPGGSRVSITIGHENSDSRLHHLSMARRRFFVGREEAGSIAIIGPTRMDYERGVSLLEFTASSISETLTRLYA
jgi:heat-inducible transcriptional repressor